MGHQGFHEDKNDLSRKTRDNHRALASLIEELEAIDWYEQRIDACDDYLFTEKPFQNLKRIDFTRRNRKIRHSF